MYPRWEGGFVVAGPDSVGRRSPGRWDSIEPTSPGFATIVCTGTRVAGHPKFPVLKQLVELFPNGLLDDFLIGVLR